VGVVLLAGGNACRRWAEQYTASGRCQHFRRHGALWDGVLRRDHPGRWRLELARFVTGLLLGFLRNALLGCSPAEILRAESARTDRPPPGERVVVVGSVYSKRHRTEDESPLRSGRDPDDRGRRRDHRRGHHCQ